MVDHDPIESRAQPIVIPPGGGRAIPLGGAGVVHLKAGRRETGGTISAYEYVAPAATAGPPVHLHRGWDELFYVVEGEMTFLIDGVEHAAPAGTLVFIPRGVLHTFWNAGAAPARQLTVFTPGGIEDYFDAVTEVMAAGGENTLEAAAALMAEHDMIVPPGARAAYGALGKDDESR